MIGQLVVKQKKHPLPVGKRAVTARCVSATATASRGDVMGSPELIQFSEGELGLRGGRAARAGVGGVPTND